MWNISSNMKPIKDLTRTRVVAMISFSSTRAMPQSPTSDRSCSHQVTIKRRTIESAKISTDSSQMTLINNWSSRIVRGYYQTAKGKRVSDLASSKWLQVKGRYQGHLAIEHISQATILRQITKKCQLFDNEAGGNDLLKNHQIRYFNL